MQINVCDVRYPKKVSAKIAISQKLLIFAVSFIKRNGLKVLMGAHVLPEQLKTGI